MIVIDNKFDIGDIVYLHTDEDQKKRFVTGISVCLQGILIYQLGCGAEVTKHYEFELSEIENILVK